MNKDKIIILNWLLQKHLNSSEAIVFSYLAFSYKPTMYRLIKDLNLSKATAYRIVNKLKNKKYLDKNLRILFDNFSNTEIISLKRTVIGGLNDKL